MEPFLEKLVKKVLTEHDSIDKLTIVLPSQRGVVYFKHYLKKHIKKASWLPSVLTIDQFVKKNSDFEPVNNIELLLNFYEAYLTLKLEKEHDTFDYFSRWAASLLADFNEIDYYLCDYKVVFNDLKNIKEIDNWSFSEDKLTDIQTKFASFWALIPTYYTTLKNYLREQKKGYNGMIYEDVARNIYQVVDYYEPSSVYFAGFNALSNAEKQIIQTFVSSKKGSFIIDADEFYVGNSEHEAGFFIRKNLKTDFLNSSNWINNFFKETTKNITAIGASSNIIQAKTAGDILSKMSPQKLNNTAVVLADEQLLSPVLNSIPDHIEKYNISMGYSLFKSPLGNLIQTIFSIQESYIKHKGGIFYQHFFSLIDHYLLDVKEQTEQLKKEIIRKNMLFLSSKKIASFPVLKEFHFLFKQWEDASLFEQSKIIFHELIKTLKQKQDISQNALELEYLFAFEQLINKLDKQLVNHQYINSLDTLKQLYFSLLKTESVSFVGEPLDGLQVIGMLETRSIDFENIIMLSVNEDLLPKSELSNSYIPFELKKIHQLPTFKEKESIYANHFYRLLQRCSNAYLIYNDATSGMGSSEKSRYINQIIEELPAYNPNIKVEEKQVIINPVIEKVEALTINSSERIIDRINNLNIDGFSATSLRTFINCKLDFYFKYIIGLKEEDEVNETIEANTLGSIIHKVLEDLYEPLLNRILIEQDIEKLIKQFEGFLKKEFIEQYSADYESGKNALLFYAAKQTIKQFLEQELELVKNNELIIKGLEVEFKKELTISINNKPTIIRLRGTIDRIDELNGNIRLVDYKTGKVEASDLNFDSVDKLTTNPKKEKAFQLLFYLLLVNETYENKTVQAGIISFKSISKGLLELKLNEKKLSDLLVDFEEQLELLIQNIYNHEGTFEHNEKSKYCVYCD